MSMSLPLIGALIGLAFAAVEYFLFGALIRRAAQRGEAGQGPRILDLVRKAQLIVYPLAGWIVGSYMAADSSGAL
jgi:hypothetical protein